MIFRFGEFELDPGARELRRRGAALPLQPKVFDLLLHLVRNRHRTVGRDELLRVVWPGVRVTPASVSRALKSARRALGDDGARQALLRTMPGAGVRFVAEVHAGEGGAPEGAARDAPPSGYVGRKETLANLRARLDRAVAGQGGVVLLTGEPGIGKTRTASEVLAWGAAAGARALVASASAADGTPAFWLWRALLARLPEAEPEEAERRGESAESARLRLFETLRRALAGAAERMPLALLLDDLHEADEASIALLDALVPDLAARPILVLGTLRPAAAASPPVARALERLARRAGVERLEIGPLSPGEVAELAARWSGAPLSEADAARLAELTTGNPLWVEEGLRGASGRSAAVALDWGSFLDSSLERTIGARLGELPAAMRRWLGAAAVLGVAFDPGLASRVAAMSPRAGAKALGAARGRRLLLEEEGARARTARFAHPLFRQVLYGRLAALEREALHARAADALEQLGEPAPLEEIAHHHLTAGGAADAAHAAGWGARAGARAERAGAFDRAADLYDRALRRLGRAPADAKTACELAIALARVRRRLGDDAAAEPAARAMAWARAHRWPRAFAEAALAFAGPMDGYHLPRPELVGVLEEALVRVGPDDRDLRARLLARLASEESFAPGSRRDELGREALTLARNLGDAALEVEIAETPFAAISENLSPAEQLSLSDRLQRQGEDARSDVVVLQARLLRLHALLASGEIEPFDAEHARAEAQAQAMRDPVALYRLELWSAARALLAGDPERSERIAHAAFARVGHGQFEGAAGLLGGQLVLARADQGRLAEGIALVEHDAQLRVGPASRCFLAWAYAEVGDAEGCRRALARAVEAELPTLGRHTWFRANAWLLARAAWFVGDASPAPALEALLAPARDRVAVRGGIAAHGPVSHALALLASLRGDTAAAAALFDEAEALARRMGAPRWLARIEADRSRSAARTA